MFKFKVKAVSGKQKKQVRLSREKAAMVKKFITDIAEKANRYMSTRRMHVYPARYPAMSVREGKLKASFKVKQKSTDEVSFGPIGLRDIGRLSAWVRQETTPRPVTAKSGKYLAIPISGRALTNRGVKIASSPRALARSLGYKRFHVVDYRGGKLLGIWGMVRDGVFHAYYALKPRVVSRKFGIVHDTAKYIAKYIDQELKKKTSVIKEVRLLWRGRVVKKFAKSK